jgi:hypothetical protein
MPTNTFRTIGIIRLADEHYRSELDAEPQDLASTLKWLVGDADVVTENSVPTLRRFSGDTVDKLQQANSNNVSADLDTIYSQLDEELQRLTTY